MDGWPRGQKVKGFTFCGRDSRRARGFAILSDGDKIVKQWAALAPR